MTKDIGFFDDDCNSPGDLADFLVSKVTVAESLFGETLDNLAKTISTMSVALVIIFSWGQWQLALISLAILPILSISVMTRTRTSGAQRNSRATSEVSAGKTLSDTFEKVAKDESKTAGALIGEVVLGVRTVVAFNAQRHFFEEYADRVRLMAQKAKARHMVTALGDALFCGAVPPLIALMVWYGSWLSSTGAMGSLGGVGSMPSAAASSCTGGLSIGAELIEGIMVPMMVVFYASASIGNTLGNMTDLESAKEAARALFERLDAETVRNPLSAEGIIPSSVAGRIELREVSFAYPSSPTHAICRGCSLHIDAGEVCALVGPSGSGKSTVIQLIERFYDPQSGCVLFDGVDIKTLNLQWLRSQLGLVSQEPVLFMGTVAENIGYGQPGARQDQIEASARMANAHTFIMESLGDGYRTQVGLRGSKLSGGQKQRVAIARALVRNPTVLLLDEATSALDNESERIVQSALDKVVAERKRTTLTIAHRLSTIRDADRIIVLSGGAVVEEGTHGQLLAKQGLYRRLTFTDKAL